MRCFRYGGWQRRAFVSNECDHVHSSRTSKQASQPASQAGEYQRARGETKFILNQLWQPSRTIPANSTARAPQQPPEYRCAAFSLCHSSAFNIGTTDRRDETRATQGGKQRSQAKRETGGGYGERRIVQPTEVVIVTATTFQLAETSFPLSRLCGGLSLRCTDVQRAPTYAAYRMPRALSQQTYARARTHIQRCTNTITGFPCGIFSAVGCTRLPARSVYSSCKLRACTSTGLLLRLRPESSCIERGEKRRDLDSG